MGRQSFSDWHLPHALDGVLLLDDTVAGGGRYTSQERHFHEELELHFIARGRCLLLLRDHRLEARAGTLLWVPPGRDHLLLDGSRDLVRWLLLVRRRAARRVLPADAALAALRRRGHERAGMLEPRAAAALERTYREVHAQFARAGVRALAGDADLPLINAAIGYALARAHQLFQSARPGVAASAFHPAVTRSLDALRDSVPPPSLAWLARRARLSPAHLSKLFSAQVGMSVTEFRNRMRLDRFLQLYGDGRRVTLMAAALDAGFGSYPQFHRVFRQLMGCSPAEHARTLAG